MVRGPGRWHLDRIAAAGSSTITSVRARPRLRRAARSERDVSGHGTGRRLTYSVTRPPGSLGLVRRTVPPHLPRARPRRRRTRHASLHPAAGTAGAERSTRSSATTACSAGSSPSPATAPRRPLVPGRVHGLQIHRRGRRFQIRFGTAAGASYYLLTARSRDGRHLLRLIRRTGHSLTLPVLGYNDHLRLPSSESQHSDAGDAPPAGERERTRVYVAIDARSERARAGRPRCSTSRARDPAGSAATAPAI